LLTRILKIHLGDELKAELKQVGSKGKLATMIGVSPQTLDSMMADEWQYITRDSIARAADHLKLSAEKVFEFVPVNFWEPIHQANQCTFLRGSQDSEGFFTDFSIPGLDNQATHEIEEYLRTDSLRFIYADRKREIEELLELARTKNCIVIGGSKSNAATEVLLSKFFDAEPFDSSEPNRQKIPFGFCYGGDDTIVKESSLTCSSMAREKTKDSPGIALEGVHVPSDYREDEEDYFTADIKKGTDAGLVFVANRPFKTTENVKLIVVAGFTGIGTVGACRALIKDFRYLEPLDEESCVYGVVKVTYSKKARDKNRTFKKYEWIYRKGGHLPINRNQK